MYEVPENIMREMKRLEEERRSFIENYRGFAAWLHPDCPSGEYEHPAPDGARCHECDCSLSGEYFLEIEGFFHCYDDCPTEAPPYITAQEFLALSPSEQEDLVYAAHNEAEQEDMLLPVVSSSPYGELLGLYAAEKELPGENIFRWSSLYVQVQGETLHLYEIREADCAVFWAGPLERSYKILEEKEEENDPLEENEPLSFKITSEGGELRCECNMPYAGHRTWILKNREFFSCTCDHTSWTLCQGHVFGHEEPLIPVAAEDVPLTARTLLLAAASCLRS